MQKPLKFFVFLALHIVPTVLILYFSSKVLADPKGGTEGVVTLKILDLFSRGLPNPIQDLGPQASALGKAIPNQVTSAIAAAETAVSQTIQKFPSGVAAGIKSACLLQSGGLALNIASTIAYVFRNWFSALKFLSFALSFVGFVVLLAFAIFTLAIVALAKGITQAGSAHTGTAFGAAIGDIAFSLTHVAVSFASLWCGP